MKRLTSNLNFWILSIVLAGTYLSQRANLIFLLVILILLLAKNKFIISFNMPGEKLYFLMLFWGIFIGLIGLYRNVYTNYEIFKHAYYYIVLFLYWHIGEQLIRTKQVQRNIFFENVLIAAFIISTVDIIGGVFNITKVAATDIYSFRNLIGAGNIISVIGIYLCLTYKKEIELSKNTINLILGVCVISSLIHFSRMMLLYIAIFALASGIRLINAKWLKYIVIGLLSVGMIWIVFPELTQLYINKLLSSFTEINFKTNIWNRTTIIQNWRGYEVSCAIDQFKHSTLFNRLFGSGFGTTLDVKGYAYLVTDDERLSFLHNGYFTQILIWGIVGIACFFLWIILFFKNIKKFEFEKDKKFARSLIAIVLVANYFVMGPFFSATVASLFFYIGILLGLNKNTLNERKVGI